jgi:hypothetical protein
MSEIRNERRRFTRVNIDLPAEVHQGGSVWKQRLIDLSLGGAATDQPDVWDAQYNEPFTLIIHISDDQQPWFYCPARRSREHRTTSRFARTAYRRYSDS